MTKYNYTCDKISMFDQTFKNLEDIMFIELGFKSEVDYAEQSSWNLFLKCLDNLESERVLKAQITWAVFRPLFEEQYRWSEWATPKTSDGKPDLDETRNKSDLVDFVN